MKKPFLTICAIFLSILYGVAQTTYKIGDIYQQGNIKGIVFYVDHTGRHGKIVSLDEFYGSWAIGNYAQTKIGAISTTDGNKNLNVIKSISNWKSNFPLFYKYDDRGNGWYIPAKDELFQIGLQAKKINYTLSMYGYKELSSNYYSSTEVNGYSVWSTWIDRGRLDCYEVYKDSKKGGVCKVRFITKF